MKTISYEVHYFFYDGNSSSGGFSHIGKFLMSVVVLDVILKMLEKEREKKTEKNKEN